MTDVLFVWFLRGVRETNERFNILFLGLFLGGGLFAFGSYSRVEKGYAYGVLGDFFLVWGQKRKGVFARNDCMDACIAQSYSQGQTIPSVFKSSNI